MGDLLFYLLKSGCYLIIFYLLFKLLMSGTTFFRFNRVTILAGIIGCMFLPLIEFTTQEETFLTVPLQTIQGIFVEQADGIFGDTMFWVRPQVDETGNMQAINWCPIALGYVYLAGGLFVLCRILLSFYRMFQLIRNGKRRSYGKYKLIVVSEPISSFCWGKYIVVSVSDYSQQSTDGILLHETMHLRYRHTLDLLCMQCLLILYWFNPAIWLLKRELQEVHEFEADNGVLNTGIDATRYQLLLVKKAVGTRLYSMANGFNHSKLKKRITMMLKKKSNPWARLKYLYVLPLAAIAVTAFARPEISEKVEEISAVKGRVIGTDPSTDLALVKIEGDDFPTIPVGDSEALKVGEWVLAVVNPFNLNSTVTAGIVSAKARSLGVYNNGIESFIQTDAAINQGNSGGALVNAKGELVGINSVLSSPTGAYAGYGFAIPTSIMTKVIADLKQYGTVQRALLGIRGGSIGSSLMDDRQPIDNSGKTLADKAKELGVVEGVWVSEIVENGSASGADIKVDDVIIGLDNKKVSNMADLQEAIAKHRPGDKVKVKLIRDKKEKTVEVTLKNEQGTTKIVKDAGMEILGAAFKELPDDLKKQLNVCVQ